MYAIPYSGGTLLDVWIQPRASKAKIAGLHGGSVKITVKSPPLEGRANEECIEILSDVLSLPKRQLAIKSGQHSRHKSIFIQGVAPEDVKVNIENALKSV